ncbi:hypothetical protein PR202_ga02622 [Eleusine coracana subsp. coracana]|uniref:Organelle RRM domain-containing protein 1, chloroplastic n=1 Tax=Eleusine coracana subsp. coracana TaxID=191504 RepID=A0AAV5BLX1_ELECO|nr:hypothetical protein PR202_ga02622 [Eleusine coracana subsp. coracana]
MEARYFFRSPQKDRLRPKSQATPKPLLAVRLTSPPLLLAARLSSRRIQLLELRAPSTCASRTRCRVPRVLFRSCVVCAVWQLPAGEGRERDWVSALTTTAHAAKPAMDAILNPLLLGGGISPSIFSAARTVSTHYLSPSAVRLTALHRHRRRFPLLAAAASESPSASLPSASSASHSRCSRWVVVMDRPPGAAGGSLLSRAEAVGYYASTLASVLGSEEEAQMRIYHASWDGTYEFCCEISEEASRELASMLSNPRVNEMDAQVSIYHISWERDYGFCCHIDEECAKELSGNISLASSEGTEVADVKTKRLFVTGLSFYTSDKTLREAFEPFGELVEVKIIMDRISKRSKGYAFIEYTTEEAGGAALKAMNGQIINGWMIVVDVAKTRSKDRQSGGPNQTFRPMYHSR